MSRSQIHGAYTQQHRHKIYRANADNPKVNPTAHANRQRPRLNSMPEFTRSQHCIEHTERNIRNQHRTEQFPYFRKKLSAFFAPIEITGQEHKHHHVNTINHTTKARIQLLMPQNHHANHDALHDIRRRIAAHILRTSFRTTHHAAACFLHKPR